MKVRIKYYPHLDYFNPVSPYLRNPKKNAGIAAIQFTVSDVETQLRNNKKQ